MQKVSTFSLTFTLFVRVFLLALQRERRDRSKSVCSLSTPLYCIWLSLALSLLSFFFSSPCQFQSLSQCVISYECVCPRSSKLSVLVMPPHYLQVDALISELTALIQHSRGASKAEFLALTSQEQVCMRETGFLALTTCRERERW